MKLVSGIVHIGALVTIAAATPCCELFPGYDGPGAEFDLVWAIPGGSATGPNLFGTWWNLLTSATSISQDVSKCFPNVNITVLNYNAKIDFSRSYGNDTNRLYSDVMNYTIKFHWNSWNDMSLVIGTIDNLVKDSSASAKNRLVMLMSTNEPLTAKINETQRHIWDMNCTTLQENMTPWNETKALCPYVFDRTSYSRLAHNQTKAMLATSLFSKTKLIYVATAAAAPDVFHNGTILVNNTLSLTAPELEYPATAEQLLAVRAQIRHSMANATENFIAF